MWYVAPGPIVEPISVDELREELSLIHNADDARLALLIKEAREFAERRTGLALVDADYSWSGDENSIAPFYLSPATAIEYPGGGLGYTTTKIPLTGGVRSALMLYAKARYLETEMLQVMPLIESLLFSQRTGLGV
ncbi:head-tail connector protein [Aquilutibacter rugosus]|uniref:hypothetical protein n=1 Tax=Aquilutibacter rugosus TaxID=3115820 RepID=UPI002F42D39C